MNATQKTIAPVGQTSGITAPTVSALYRLHGSVGTTGREPSMEFQMRNKTFISSMVGIAAAAAVAGSANAGFVDNFNRSLANASPTVQNTTTITVTQSGAGIGAF
jgi:hypothetical protein